MSFVHSDSHNSGGAASDAGSAKDTHLEDDIAPSDGRDGESEPAQHTLTQH